MLRKPKGAPAHAGGAVKKPMGRPSSYSEAIADAICERLANGESLKAICAEDGMPGRETVRQWQAANEAFGAKCARAREAQADSEHDKMAEIEDRVLSGDLDPVAARVVLASKQWRASKLAPKKYGDKLELGGAIEVRRASEMTDDELAGIAGGSSA